MSKETVETLSSKDPLFSKYYNKLTDEYYDYTIDHMNKVATLSKSMLSFNDFIQYNKNKDKDVKKEVKKVVNENNRLCKICKEEKSKDNFVDKDGQNVKTCKTCNDLKEQKALSNKVDDCEKAKSSNQIIKDLIKKYKFKDTVIFEINEKSKLAKGYKKNRNDPIIANWLMNSKNDLSNAFNDSNVEMNEKLALLNAIFE